MSTDKLVSTRRLREGLKDLEAQIKADAPYIPDFAAKRDERLILEVRRILKEAEVEYLSTGAAAELTGWEAGTLRKYARKALDAEPLPAEWAGLIVRREGKEYAIVLSSIPPKSARNAA